MQISGIIAQLRTTDLAASIAFYITKLGMTLAFQHRDFYAGIQAGSHLFHLKRVDNSDPSIAFVEQGQHFHLYFDTHKIDAVADQVKRNGIALLQDVHDTPWGTREFVIADDQGHILYFGEARR